MAGDESAGTPVRIAVIGDRSPNFVAQDSIEPALRHSGATLGVEVAVEWFATDVLAESDADLVAAFDGVWCAPGSPYRSMEGALRGIETARSARIPFLGTCAGFQHGVIEFARNVLGNARAHHAEYQPGVDAADLFIDELLCSLVGQRLEIAIDDPRTREIFGSGRAAEEYYCRFGLNEVLLPALQAHGMIVAGVDERDGSTRILRLADSRFFYLTLFVPQARSTAAHPHPLVTAFVGAAAARHLAEPIVIRRLGGDDIEVLHDLSLRDAEFDVETRDPDPRVPLAPSAARTLLERDDVHLFVAFAGDAPAGFVLVHELLLRHDEARELLVYELGVQRDHWRQGIATRLLGHVRDFARAQGINVGWVPTDASNTAAMATYTRAGGTRERSDDLIYVFDYRT